VYYPVGVSDFKELITYKNPATDDGYAFVDKTNLIDEITRDGSKVIVLTRPRRFGKTINLSMLSYFFNIQNKEENSKLFEGLNISNQKEIFDKEQGKYPVIFISFKDVKQSGFQEAKSKIVELLSTLFDPFRFILNESDISDSDKLKFKSILDANADNARLTSSLNILTRVLNTYYKKPVILLIDEYDTPMHSAYLGGYYDEMVSFMRSILGESLKDNTNIHKAILTGILRISKESIFSGLNNVKVRTILSSQYSDAFGFTEDEVEEFLSKSGLDYQIDNIRNWYNGYLFGGATLYNPWSIINLADQGGETAPYWANTSSNELIKKILIQSDEDTKDKIFMLLNGEDVTETIDEHLAFQDLDQSRSALWTLFLMSGYLKVVSQKKDDLYGPICTMKIPNMEVESIYAKTFREWISGNKGILWYQELLKNLTEGNIEPFKEQLKYILEHVSSVHDVTKKTQESFYHGVAIGLVSGLKREYYIQSNRESGQGFYDLAIIPKNGKDLAIVMEFKSLHNAEQKQLDEAAQEALAQIDNKGYVTEAKSKTVGKVLKLGIAFSGKTLCLASSRC